MGGLETQHAKLTQEVTALKASCLHQVQANSLLEQQLQVRVQPGRGARYCSALVCCMLILHAMASG